MAVKRNIKTMKNKTSQYYTIFFNYANVLLFRLILNYADMIHIWNLLFMFVVKNDMKKIIVILAVVMASCSKQNNLPLIGKWQHVYNIENGSYVQPETNEYYYFAECGKYNNTLTGYGNYILVNQNTILIDTITYNFSIKNRFLTLGDKVYFSSN